MDLLDNTLILFTSDHGEMLGDHHLGAKSLFFEGSAHIPLIVCPPGFPDEQRGTACDGLATLADILITCANISGVSLPADCPQDGIDLLSMQRKESSRPFFVGECGEHFAILEDHAKYVYCLNGGGELLFDLTTDPYEQHNLMAEPSHATVLTRLRQRLVAHMQQHHPETVADGKIIPQPVREVRDLRSRWPGHHSRKLPEEVLH
jgi:arylsulfatase